MLYKDSCNRKSNQQVIRGGWVKGCGLVITIDALLQNLGTIKCSNLCTEIVEYTSRDEVGVTIN